MKKSFFILEIVLMILLIGCQEDDSPNLIIREESIQAEYSGGTINIPIICNVASKASVTYDSPDESGWIFLLPAILNGNGVYTLWVDSYSNVLKDRSATIIVTAGNDVKIIKLIQLVKPALGIEPESVVAVNEAKSYRITVTCRGAWNANVNSEASSWCTLSDDEGEGISTFSVNVRASNLNEERTAMITISSGGLQSTLTVQQGYGILINGLLWAKCDVGEPNHFANSPNTRGLLYQYDSKIGYPNSSPNPSGAPQGYRTGQYPLGDTWSVENNPCPSGWRIPTYEEIGNLVGSSENPKFTWAEPGNNGFAIPGTIVGITRKEGLLATKIDMRGGIFLPQSGYRDRDTGRQDTWWPANITSSSRPGQNWDRWIYWMDNNNNIGSYFAGNATAFPVRCVSDISNH